MDDPEGVLTESGKNTLYSENTESEAEIFSWAWGPSAIIMVTFFGDVRKLKEC